jgi:hypothetical protein
MQFIQDTHGDAVPLPKAFMDEFSRLDKKAEGVLFETVETPTSEALKKARIDPRIEPEEAPMVASIDNTPFATLGNFSCIIGKAKSKKTFLITLVVGAFLKGAIGTIQAFQAKGKRRVIWFDTEQSRGHVVKAFRRALALSCDSEFYDIEVYDLRPHSPKERRDMVTMVLVDTNQNKDIAFGVIDGIRDMVTDINDPVQATDISTWLMKITGDQELHVCTVLHQNKSDLNARGHLGTEIVNKAESVISVQKESDTISKVQAEFYRNSQEFKPFYFTIDEVTTLPQILQGYSGGGFTENVAGRTGGSNLPNETHREVMAKVFSFDSEYSYTDLITQAKIQYNDAGHPMGDNRVKEAIRKCINDGIIEKEGTRGSKTKYTLNHRDEISGLGVV